MARTRLSLERGLALLLLGAAQVTAASSGASDGREGEVPGVGPEQRTVVAGEQYRRSGFYRFLFGADYRDLWTTPLSLPVLDLQTFGGGLTPQRVVGHGQSKGLALKGGDGRSYTFRPLRKDATGLLPVELRESKARDFVQDQMASGHPAGHVMVGPLLDAVGILHNNPRLVIMPDSPALGDFRKEFANAPGDIEEFTGTPGFGGTLETIDGEEMWKRLRESPAVRPDSRAYLKARLIDQLIGDWDRHRNQWRWARVTGKERWQPMPEDRDQAFVRFEGVAISNLRPTLPLLIKFRNDYSSLHGLTFDGWDVDKRILADLEKPVWDEAAREVQAALTDSVLENAVRAMPPEYFPKDGARLLAGLKSRRDKLPEQAARFYRFINGTVDVFGTDQAERVTARRESNGDLDLAVGLAAPGSEPYFRRRFRKEETDEVRVYVYGGDDQVDVSGGRHGGVLLRVIGAEGRDVLDDTQGGGTRFSSSDPDDQVKTGPGTHWDRGEYEPPPKNKSGEWIPPKDWGRHTYPTFRLTYEPDLGVLINASLITTGYGFRKHPFANRQVFRFTYAAEETAFRGFYDGDFRSENSPRRTGLFALASGLEIQRFFGLGNDTEIEGDADDYKVELRQYALAPNLAWALGSSGDLRLGLIGKYSDSDTASNPVLGDAEVYGEGTFGQLGAALALEIDTTGDLALPARGLRFELAGSVFPKVWDVESTFGKVFADARVFLAPSGSWQPTLVLGAGGQKVFGDAPFFDSAFLGGRVRLGRYEPGGQGAVRGLRPQRYAGDGTVYGNADLYLPVTRTSFLGIPLQFGLHGFADVGRVYLEGESSDTWHHGLGGGIYFASPGRRNLFSFTLAQAEGRTAFYLRTGFAF
jgi:hypothetical protein